MGTAEWNLAFARLIIRELQRQGIRHFCISPGARSAPLAVAALRSGLSVHVGIDERAAAYLALGIGRASGSPAVVITTSGTAVANCLPAVVEADQELVPLIILSADRPAELRDTRANQTIRQPQIFGDYTRWSFDLPVPAKDASYRAAISTAAAAVRKATQNPAGPVHLNCQFREPLLPEPDAVEFFKDELDRIEPFTRFAATESTLRADEAQVLAERLQSVAKGLVLLGDLTPAESAAVQPFLARLGWPVLADVRSGWLPGNPGFPVLGALDLLYRSPKLKTALSPEVVLHMGGQPVSKQLLNFLNENRAFPLIHVDMAARRTDPVHRNSLSIDLSPADFCHAMPDLAGKPDPAWVESWTRVLDALHNLLENKLNHFAEGEGALLRTLYRHLPKDAGLFLASSSAIRLAEMFRTHGQRMIPTFANRGASGIDGNLATALGIGIGGEMPVTAVLGDLAMLHDLNSLLLLQHARQPFVLVVLNNSGGEIFSWLPYRLPEEEFEKVMATPHSLQFAPLAEAFGVNSVQVRNVEDFAREYGKSVKNGGVCLIEFLSDRHTNARFVKEVFLQSAEALDALF